MELKTLKARLKHWDNFFYSMLLFFCFVFSTHSFSADSLSYSGRLVKADGSPVAGPVNLTIDLAYTNDPTTILCSQNFSSVVLSNGVFHLKLDLVCPGPPVKTLTEILTSVPANFAAALRVRDDSNNKTYAFQEIHSMPFATISETAKQLTQLGAGNGEVLKWNDTTKKWEPGPASVGTVTGVTASTPLVVANGTSAPALSINQATTSTDGYLSAADWNAFNSKQGALTGGLSTQYYRGDNSWQTLDTSAVPQGATNLYFTNALALGVPLGASLNAALTGNITSADTILSAFGRTQNQINSLSSSSANYLLKNTTDSVTGQVTINATTGSLLLPRTPSDAELTQAANVNYVKTYADTKLPLSGGTLTNDLTLNTQARFKGGSNYVELKANAALASNIALTLPMTVGANGDVLSSNGAGVLSWVNPSSLPAGSGTVTSSSIVDDSIMNADINSAAAIDQSKIAGLTTALGNKVSSTLATGKILVGSAGSVATAVSVSGDATLSDLGLLTLTNSGVVANTYKSVTVDAKGRVTGGTNPTTLAGFGITDTLVTNVSVTAPITVSGTTAPLIAMPAATNAVDGYLTAADRTAFNAKQAAITANSILNSREIRFNELTANGPEYVSLKAPDALSANTTYTLPSSDGTSGQVLTTNAAGALSWTSVATTATNLAGDISGTIASNNIGTGKVTSTHLLDGTIVNADIAAGANIAATKLATGLVTDIEFNYLDGVTSAIQTQLNAKQASGNYVSALTGDVTAAGPGSVAATVAAVGGVSAANVATGANLANAASNLNTANTIVKRDASGNFSAGTITATLNGIATNVSGTVAVANGGTGKTTLALNQLLFGNGTSAIGELALPGLTTTSVLLSTVTTGAPLWTTSTAGNVLKGSITGVAFGPLSSTDLPAGTLSGSGTTNYVPYYSAATTLANSPIYISGSSVGIGTTTPTSILQVSDIYTNTLDSSGLGISIFGSANDYGGLTIWDRDGNPATTNDGDTTLYWGDDVGESLRFAFKLSGAALSEKMRILSNGNVGIGTNAPATKLTVSDVSGARIRAGGAVGSGFELNDVNTRIDIPLANTMAFYSSNLERIRIDAAGNVGIGVLAPGYKLDVAGQGNFSTTTANVLKVTGAGTGYADSINGVATIYSENTVGSGGNVIKVGSAFAPNALIVKDTGNVGIGTTNPQAKLDISGGIKLGSMTACGASQEGSQRYNSTLKIMEFCDGVAWQSFAGSSSVPTGAIMAFDLATCPTGWSEYTQARGQFLRGIDNGAGVDPSGTRAAGNIQAENWRGFSLTNTVQNGTAYSHGPVDMGKSTASYVGNIFVGYWSAPAAGVGLKWNAADETRPTNVAVLYCRKN